jgi:hypothetical protein
MKIVCKIVFGKINLTKNYRNKDFVYKIGALKSKDTPAHPFDHTLREV